MPEEGVARAPGLVAEAQLLPEDRQEREQDERVQRPAPVRLAQVPPMGSYQATSAGSCRTSITEWSDHERERDGGDVAVVAQQRVDAERRAHALEAADQDELDRHHQDGHEPERDRRLQQERDARAAPGGPP
jgi:hypothetical protein